YATNAGRSARRNRRRTRRSVVRAVKSRSGSPWSGTVWSGTVWSGTGGGERGADDARVVLQARRYHLGVDLQVREPVLGLLADAAADDEQRRAEQQLQVRQVLLGPAGPLRP